MTCPVCKSEYVHFNRPKFLESDDYSAWQGRGDALRVPFWCEEGHSWYVRYGHHKGNSYKAINRVYDRDLSEGL